jgi:hypothetical protein
MSRCASPHGGFLFRALQFFEIADMLVLRPPLDCRRAATTTENRTLLGLTVAHAFEILLLR